MSLFTNFAWQLREKYPKFSLRIKEDSKFMKVLAWLTKPFNPDFMQNFTVANGYTIYMPKDLIGTDAGYRVLRHEAVHIADFDKWGWWMRISYFLLLPAGITMRAYWELKAYKESLRVCYEMYGKIPDYLIEYYVELFTGPKYVWMLPFPKTIRKSLLKERDRIINGN